MIPIKKGAAPALLTSDGTKFQDNAVKFAKGEAYDSSYKKDFKKHGKTDDYDRFDGSASKLFSTYSYYSNPEVKRQLIEEHYGKCAFCECFIMDHDVGDVEHYRPKAGIDVVNRDEPSDKEGVTGHPGYFWLSQTWDNLLLSCKQCNQAYKKNFFDVVPGALWGQGEAFPRLRHDRASSELSYLINPADPSLNPRDVIRFNPSTAKAVPVEGGSTNPDEARLHMTRAQRSIEIVGLNRPRLIEARAKHLLSLRSFFLLAALGGGTLPVDGQAPDVFRLAYSRDCAGKDALTALQWAVSPQAEFSALAQDAVATWNSELTTLEAGSGITDCIQHGSPRHQPGSAPECPGCPRRNHPETQCQTHCNRSRAGHERPRRGLQRGPGQLQGPGQ